MVTNFYVLVLPFHLVSVVLFILFLYPVIKSKSQRRDNPKVDFPISPFKTLSLTISFMSHANQFLSFNEILKLLKINFDMCEVIS